MTGSLNIIIVGIDCWEERAGGWVSFSGLFLGGWGKREIMMKNDKIGDVVWC